MTNELKEKIDSKEHLARIVNDIIAICRDDEVAHYEEDILHLRVIEQFCPDWVVAEIERLSNADFSRWYS